MKIIHLISGGDVGGAKTHVHSLLCGLAKTEEVQLVWRLHAVQSRQEQRMCW